MISIVMWSDTLRSVILAKLTVSWEANIEWAHERKATKYHDLKNQIEDDGWKCHVYPVEVGCRGFVGQSTVKFLNAIGVAPRIRQATIRKLQEIAETASVWIWNSRDQMKTIPWICYERSYSEFYLLIWNQLVFNQRLQLFVQLPQPYLLIFAWRN